MATQPKPKELLGNFRPHKKVTLAFKKPSRTKQEFREDCDVNVIIKRFTRTGIIPNTVTKSPRYIDAGNLPTLQDSMQIMIEADKAFMRLPAQVRKEFDNEPMKFVEFATDKDNLPKLQEWGLAPQPKAPEPPLKVEVTNPQKPEEKP